jgi:hypothetical protein
MRLLTSTEACTMAGAIRIPQQRYDPPAVGAPGSTRPDPVTVGLDTLHSHQLDAFSKNPVQFRARYPQWLEVSGGDRRQPVFAENDDAFVGRNRDRVHAPCITKKRSLSTAPSYCHSAIRRNLSTLNQLKSAGCPAMGKLARTKHCSPFRSLSSCACDASGHMAAPRAAQQTAIVLISRMGAL